MIVLQYDPYTQTAKFQNQNEENGHVSDFIHLSKEQKDALNMLKKDIILQNQIENLVRVLKQIDSSQSFRFIGTSKDYRDFSEGVKQLAPGGVVKKTDSPFFYDAPYIRDALEYFSNCEYWCMCDEKGDECETLHTHVYMVFKKPVPHKQIEKHFPKMHRERVKGKSSENRDYIRKEGEKFNKKDDGSYEYIDILLSSIQ